MSESFIRPAGNSRWHWHFHDVDSVIFIYDATVVVNDADGKSSGYCKNLLASTKVNLPVVPASEK